MSSNVIEFNPAVPPALVSTANGASTIGEAYSLNVPSLATDPLMPKRIELNIGQY